MAAAAAAADVELLLVRIDHFQDRAQYVSVLREWLRELGIAHGRLIRMGADLQLLFVAASAAQNAQLRQWYRTRPIDTNGRGAQCVDRFVDVLGAKTVQCCSCRGFVEMEVLVRATRDTHTERERERDIQRERERSWGDGRTVGVTD